MSGVIRCRRHSRTAAVPSANAVSTSSLLNCSPDAEGVPEGDGADAVHQADARVAALQHPHRLRARLKHQIRLHLYIACRRTEVSQQGRALGSQGHQTRAEECAALWFIAKLLYLHALEPLTWLGSQDAAD